MTEKNLFIAVLSLFAERSIVEGTGIGRADSLCPRWSWNLRDEMDTELAPSDITTEPAAKCPDDHVDLVFAIALASWLMLAFSNAGLSVDMILLTMLFVGLWLLGVLVRIVVFAWRRHRTARNERRSISILRPVVEASIVLGSIALAAVCAPMLARFHLCRAALERYADDVIAGRVAPQEPSDPVRSVGLYFVTETELVTENKGPVVRLITTDTYLDHAGFVYSPHGRPPVLGEDFYSDLGDSWYHWRRSW